MSAQITFRDISFKCPYCGHLNNWTEYSFLTGTDHQFHYCNSDDGGCDKKLIIESKVTTELKITALPICSIKN